MEESQTTNAKRIAKNTFALYFRMLVSLIVSLYTSRVVLATLGVADFGIYGVVGGVVGMFSFLNGAQSGATSRFFNFEMGKGDSERLKQTFASALIVHFCIALVVFLAVETFGIWFLENKLVIPEERMTAARWVLQLSLISMFFSVIQVPFNACIISHENMTIYAYIELLNVFLKLGIVYLLTIGNFDKLILYAALHLFVTILITTVYKVYCAKHYEESHFKFVWNKEMLKSLVSFSGFNLFGNMGSIVNTQGTNFVVNIFFGVIYNAAVGIAATVSGAIQGFASNIQTAFKPQIIKDYARGDYKSFEFYLDMAIKAISFVYCIVAIPAFIEMDQVLSIWLKEVPACASIFCRLMLIDIYFANLRFIVIMGIHAYGKVKTVSLFTGCLNMINPFIIWMIFRLGAPASFTYIPVILVDFSLVCIDFYLLHNYIHEISISRLIRSAITITIICATSLIVSHIAINQFDATVLRLISTVFSTMLFTSILVLFLCFNQNERRILLLKAKSAFWHK